MFWGGVFSVRESHSYLKSFNDVKFCVVGASTRFGRGIWRLMSILVSDIKMLENI